MYYFKAHYINVSTCKEIIRDISFDGQFFESERECFIYAMCRAYDMACSDEFFDSLEFIAC